MNVNGALEHLATKSALANVNSDLPPEALSSGERVLLDVLESIEMGVLHDAASKLDDGQWWHVVHAICVLRTPAVAQVAS